MLHELFHLGVRASFGDIPSWLDESIASLYETSVEAQGQYFGAPNWRGEVVRQMGWGRHFRLRELVGSVAEDRVRGAHSGADRLEAVAQNDEAAYDAAVGRYFALYLQERGQLPAVYNLFRERPAWVSEMPAVEASVRLVEAATGKQAQALEADFLAWLKDATKDRDWQPARPAGSRIQEIAKELPPNLAPAPSAPGGGAK